MMARDLLISNVDQSATKKENKMDLISAYEADDGTYNLWGGIGWVTSL